MKRARLKAGPLTTSTNSPILAFVTSDTQLLEVSERLALRVATHPRSTPADRCGLTAMPPRNRSSRPPLRARRRHTGPGVRLQSCASMSVRSASFTSPLTSRSSASGNRSCSQSAWRTKYRARRSASTPSCRASSSVLRVLLMSVLAQRSDCRASSSFTAMSDGPTGQLRCQIDLLG